MVVLSLAEFVRTGRLAGLKLGSKSSEMFDRLGPPEAITSGPPPLMVKYGNVQAVLIDKEVCAISIAFCPPGQKWADCFTLDGHIPQWCEASSATIAWVQTLGLPWQRVDRGLEWQDTIRIHDSGVEIVFLDGELSVMSVADKRRFAAGPGRRKGRVRA